jgi:hypothetical protein
MTTTAVPPRSASRKVPIVKPLVCPALANLHVR